MEHLYFYMEHPEFTGRASVLAEGGEGPEGGAEAGDVAQLLLHLGGARGVSREAMEFLGNHGFKPWIYSDLMGFYSDLMGF